MLHRQHLALSHQNKVETIADPSAEITQQSPRVIQERFLSWQSQCKNVWALTNVADENLII